ncbi:MAG: ABC transporter ATP-binding protein/permease [Clostridiales bacterium]|nr:ABC transporter ATP-binding protein/permease [Clostridiales bacterium]
MINKRLIGIVPESKKYIVGNVIFQWFSLAANVAMIWSVTFFIGKLFEKKADFTNIIVTFGVSAAAVIIRYICSVFSNKMSYLSSKTVKKSLREMIYKKLLRLGISYREKVNTSEVVQVSVEGVDQLEVYFGSYLPQFFYAMLAPLTLFIVLSFINVFCAVMLLICVPLIPVSIVAVQRFAKKLLSKYWGQYTTLGDTFLENLQGMTTLKIYRADGFKQEEMNRESEKFRRITMKVLTMQLNSVTIMDLIAYGGAALGVILSVTQYSSGNLSFSQCLFIILISADFFIPMRLLGSFFHVAMNGMAASDKIFRLLSLPEPEEKTEEVPSSLFIKCEGLRFSYKKDREILQGVDMSVPDGSFISIVGESGCGKSTVASVLMGRNKGYSGSVTIGGKEIRELNEESLMRNFTYVGHRSYLFRGTVRDNLIMGNPNASDETLWKALERVKMSSFLKNEKGLDTYLAETGSNLSGGQCQRLALARALIYDSPAYIFDEASSNIDAESENYIMNEILKLAKSKTVILISHRLANVVNSDKIYVMDNGKVIENGTHNDLIEKNGLYANLWNSQFELENYGKTKE